MKSNLNVSILLRSLILFALIFYTDGCRMFDDKIRDSQTNEAERIIKDDSNYKEVDNLCKQIPVPENSKLVGKARLFKSVGISNYYYSEVESNLLWKSFEDFFIQNKWEKIDSNNVNQTLQVQKESYEVTIQFGGIGRGITYSISCAKILPDKKKS